MRMANISGFTIKAGHESIELDDDFHMGFVEPTRSPIGFQIKYMRSTMSGF